MLSFGAFQMYIAIVFFWFAIGAIVIGIFAMKELIILFRGSTEEKMEKGEVVEYEV